MCDGEAVGGLQVVNIVIEVEGFLRHILVGVVQLDSEPEGAVLLHRGAHEQSTYRREDVTRNSSQISSPGPHIEEKTYLQSEGAETDNYASPRT